MRLDPQLDLLYKFKDKTLLPKESFDFEKNLVFSNDLTITYPFEPNQEKCKTANLPKFTSDFWEPSLGNFFDLMKIDQTGLYYNNIINLIYNNEKANEKLFEFLRRYQPNLKNHLKKSYIKFNKNNEIQIFSLIATKYSKIFSLNIKEIVFSRSRSLCHQKNIRVDQKDYDSVINQINMKLFGTTDQKAIDESTIIRPRLDEDKWSIFDGSFGKYRIPSFKMICFETLKHQFLINKENGLKQIKSLTFDLLQQFIENCCSDQKPIGFEIVNTLYHDKDEQNKDEKIFNSLYPLDKLIECWLNRDTWYRNMYEFELSSEPYNTNILINVYDNYDKFNLKKLSENIEPKILMRSNFKVSTGTAANINETVKFDGNAKSIVPKDQFLKNFHKATRGLFQNKLQKYKNDFIFIGGIITHCLTGQLEGFESSDIDIVMLCSEDQTKTKDILYDIFGNDCEDDGYSINVLGGHVVFSLHYPHRPVQVNIFNFKDIQEVLLGIDIDCSCFAFNGEDVFTLERGMTSLNYRFNIASEFSFHIRGDNQYQRRLLKYLERGFDIFYHSTPEIEKVIIDYKNQNKQPSLFQSGFELLLSAKQDKEIYSKLLETNRHRSLPYGEGWKKHNFDKYLQDCFDIVFDGYSSSGVYCPSDIDSCYQFRESNREPLNDDQYWSNQRFIEEYEFFKDDELNKEELYEDLPTLDTYLNLKEGDTENEKSSKSLKVDNDVDSQEDEN